MVDLLLLLIGALAVGGIVFGVAALMTGGGDGLGDVEPDGASVPLPNARPLDEGDVAALRFDTALRGYRMSQVDRALSRLAYDLGFKSELISVLKAEVDALREGRTADADDLRDTRLAAESGRGGADPDLPGLEAEVDGEVDAVGDADEPSEVGQADEAGQARAAESGDPVPASPVKNKKSV